MKAFSEGRLNDTAGLCTSLVARDPSFGPGHYLFGVTALRAGDYGQARAALEKALALMPVESGVLANLAATYVGFGLIGEAKHLLRKIPEKHRENVSYYTQLAHVCALSDEKKEAYQAYQCANNMKPGDVSILKPLSELIAVFDGADAGIQMFVDAVELVGPQPGILIALGLFQASQSKLDDAIQSFQTVLGNDPSNGGAIVGLFSTYQKACLWKDAKETEIKLNALISAVQATDRYPDENPFLFVGRSMDSASALKLASLRSDRVERESSLLPRLPALPRRDGRLTIGYISADIMDHPVTHLCVGMFPAHDRDSHRVIVYSLGRDDGSAYRTDIARGCDKFIDLSSVSGSLIAAQMIREDGVDILVDLNGWTNARPHVLAHRPAPIQVNYMGYPGTCGSGFHDYNIVDRIICPEEDAPYYSEAFAYLSDSYMMNDDRQAVDPDSQSRTQAGLPEDAFVFVCFNRAFKIDEAIFMSWMRMMEQVPNSVLWLAAAAPLTEQTLRATVEKSGISADRLIFAPHTETKSAHLARLRHADLALDTRVFNGATTTADALWAGIPVVTVTGNHFASRITTSLLQAVGLSELACSDIVDYEAMAIALAHNPENLARVRAALSNPAETPLFGTAGKVRALENLYGQMADRYDRREPPAMISA